MLDQASDSFDSKIVAEALDDLILGIIEAVKLIVDADKGEIVPPRLQPRI